jgi:hypothetical protein
MFVVMRSNYLPSSVGAKYQHSAPTELGRIKDRHGSYKHFASNEALKPPIPIPNSFLIKLYLPRLED